MNTIEEQATGCWGAHSYREFAKSQGYKHIEVLDWSSSAGNWQFLISKDGKEWHVLVQENQYPRPGFSHYINAERTFHGTIEDVYKEIEALYG